MDRSLKQLSPSDVRDVADRFSLDDECALVTGAGNGMGRVVAFTFAAAGADLAISDRLTEDLTDTAADLRDAFDVTITEVEADVSDPDAVAGMVETATADLGDLDVLLNVAGVSTYEDSEDLEVKTWDLVQDVNLRSVFVAAREAFPHLKGGGRIVNISSIAGLYGASSMSHYGAAKAGVRNLTQSLAAEWAADNVRVNAVAPGPILTPGVSEMLDEADEDAYDRSSVDRPVGSPAEIADTMLFLASPLSSFVTGETVRVGGVPPTQEDISITPY
ncbi:SDR family oxidoreductase [Natronomonas gomsonensis]|uniref:SDR family NAD(P)-dependent oxidoreductase n=1 Tax=Natronomonas gomsonensis TaxID=1046043 RepID=UPI0020CA98F5|nr:SDR family oxidoreductase [Natronomonas gomsonensis]MCY4729917.1 SDR family oxidoreductase [Natronomonas gomsonensis]